MTPAHPARAIAEEVLAAHPPAKGPARLGAVPNSGGGTADGDTGDGVTGSAPSDDLDANQLHAVLAEFLRRERIGLSAFVEALAEFDQRRLWAARGHPSVLSYLRSDLGLSAAAAYHRRVAADLVGRFPEVEEPLRDGRLCLSNVVEVARAVSRENAGTAVSRFLHRGKPCLGGDGTLLGQLDD